MRYRNGPDPLSFGVAGATPRAIPPRRWTQTDISELRRRLGVGESAEQIADGLARSEEDVRRMAVRLGLGSRLAAHVRATGE